MSSPAVTTTPAAVTTKRKRTSVAGVGAPSSLAKKTKATEKDLHDRMEHVVMEMNKKADALSKVHELFEELRQGALEKLALDVTQQERRLDEAKEEALLVLEDAETDAGSRLDEAKAEATAIVAAAQTEARRVAEESDAEHTRTEKVWTEDFKLSRKRQRIEDDNALAEDRDAKVKDWLEVQGLVAVPAADVASLKAEITSLKAEIESEVDRVKTKTQRAAEQSKEFALRTQRLEFEREKAKLEAQAGEAELHLLNCTCY